VKQLVREFSSVVDLLNGKEINIVLTDKRIIRNLNKKFRNEDKATDVLSFPLDSEIFGELWVCPSVILQNSKNYKEKFDRELLRIVIHGLLHLCNLDHKSPFTKDSKEKIFKLQEKILEMLY